MLITDQISLMFHVIKSLLRIKCTDAVRFLNPGEQPVMWWA